MHVTNNYIFYIFITLQPCIKFSLVLWYNYLIYKSLNWWFTHNCVRCRFMFYFIWIIFLIRALFVCLFLVACILYAHIMRFQHCHNLSLCACMMLLSTDTFFSSKKELALRLAAEVRFLHDNWLNKHTETLPNHLRDLDGSIYTNADIPEQFSVEDKFIYNRFVHFVIMISTSLKSESSLWY